LISSDPTQHFKVLITVKTYPVPARRGVEVSCTAGVSDGGWIRLFPVPFRLLQAKQRFKKYQLVELDAVKAHDGRPESYSPTWDSIRVVSDTLPTIDNWRLRKEPLFNLRSTSLCELQRRWSADRFPTLGLFRPREFELLIEDEDPEWTASQLSRLRQPDMFLGSPPTELEKIPFRFRYRFRCNERDCNGHDLTCTDWEMSQSYRRWRRQYGDDWKRAFRERYEASMQRRDTHFYVGTIHTNPGSWIIVGLFYPAKEIERQSRLSI
jgi:hypothetical protein